MKFETLYEEAIALSPRAARIAALLLLDAPEIPAALRRSLAIALSGPGPRLDRASGWTEGGEEAEAALRFVARCREVGSRGPLADALK